MYVADWQQFFAAFGQPLVARVGLALRTVPVAAGVERDGLMAASGTAIQVATERGRAAKLDGVPYAQMAPRQPGSVPWGSYPKSVNGGQSRGIHGGADGAGFAGARQAGETAF